MKIVQITQKRFAELLIRNRDFAVISQEDVEKLKDFEEVHIEPKDQVFYLYWKQTWQASQERKEKRNAYVETLRLRWLRRQEAKALLVNEIVVKFNMTRDMAAKLVDSLAANKNNLPMAQGFKVLDEVYCEALFDTEIDSLWTSSIV